MQNTISRCIDDLVERGGLKDTDIANIIGVSRKAFSHLKTDDLQRQSFDESSLPALCDIVDRLNVYYTPEEVRTWLCEPHPQLGGEKAVDLILSNRTPEVFAVIDRLDNTAFV